MTPLDLLSRKVNGLEVVLTRNIKARALDTHLSEPIVSFCFDDFPRSAITEGGRMLRERGWAGTFYAAGSFAAAMLTAFPILTRTIYGKSTRMVTRSVVTPSRIYVSLIRSQ